MNAVANSLEEFKKNYKTVHRVNLERKEKVSQLDKLALAITNKVGSMGFFILIFIWTISWLLWNALAPKALQFDPFPAFVLWLFISNMIQIFLMPLLLIGQNLQSKHSEARAEADFEINTKAELEIETILQHLEYQNEILSAQNQKLKVQNENILRIIEKLDKQ